METEMRLQQRIQNRTARVGVIGLGYGGLPLAVEFAKAGFDVVGFDVDADKVAAINEGRSYIPDVATTDLSRVASSGKLRASVDMRGLGDVDIIDICVPTPLRKTRDPDLSFVAQALEAIATPSPPGSTRRPRVHDLPGHDR